MKWVIIRSIKVMLTAAVIACAIWMGLAFASSGKELQAGIGELEGVHRLKELSGKDLAATEASIRSSREAAAQQTAPQDASHDTEQNQPGTENSDQPEANMKVRFSSVVVMGDSIAKGLESYEFLESSSVVAKNGANISLVESELKKAIALNPQIIFMSYGMNDLEYLRGDAQRFAQKYEEVIRILQKNLPGVRIYINSVLPVQQKAIDKKPVYANVDAYNQAIIDMCARLGLTFVDNREYMQQEDIYQNDGIHPKIAYYPQWLQNMAAKAEI